jgi:hypothetical protein
MGSMPKEKSLNVQNIIACVWDFDKTLIPGYMQSPLFRRYQIDERRFWNEVNQLPHYYHERGQRVSPDTIYLNHLLSHIRSGKLRGLTNSVLRDCGRELEFYPGLPDLFPGLRQYIAKNPAYRKHDITVEHYIISTGLAEMVRGSKIAPHVEDVFGCEFIENPLPPNYSRQDEFSLETHFEISQIGVMVDNTIKTRFIFEINKGSNKNPEISVNANVREEDRRIPLRNMIYVADGPSDIPVFSVVKSAGGRAYAVYDPSNPDEFAQNDNLLQVGRIHAYGPADYRDESSTTLWLKMHLDQIASRIVRESEEALAHRVLPPPRHLHKKETAAAEPEGATQPDLLT